MFSLICKNFYGIDKLMNSSNIKEKKKFKGKGCILRAVSNYVYRSTGTGREYFTVQVLLSLYSLYCELNLCLICHSFYRLRYWNAPSNSWNETEPLGQVYVISPNIVIFLIDHTWLDEGSVNSVLIDPSISFWPYSMRLSSPALKMMQTC